MCEFSHERALKSESILECQSLPLFEVEYLVLCCKLTGPQVSGVSCYLIYTPHIYTKRKKLR